MFDSVTSSDIPDGSQLVAGYCDGRYRWSEADWQRHPGKVLVRIAVDPATDDGHVLDVETGDATPEQSVGWVRMRRAAGVDPSVYVNLSEWVAVRAAFSEAREPEPHYWVAWWTGHPGIAAGAVAQQYGNEQITGGHYDISAVADSWPGVDSAQTPGPSPIPAPPAEGGDLEQVDREFLYGELVKLGHAAGVAIDAPPWAAAAGGRTYIVKPGDSLSEIAANHSGGAWSWQQLYEDNKGIIGGDPNLIRPGQVLTLPS